MILSGEHISDGANLGKLLGIRVMRKDRKGVSLPIFALPNKATRAVGAQGANGNPPPVM